MMNISSSDEGYRVIINVGRNGGQEVPHLHCHIFGGEEVGKMVV
jgi:histidine triad (HIT) family protein